jgi:predicted small secreted protein
MTFKRIAPVAAILATALLASACANTIRGAGRDAANTVNATQSAAKNVAGAAEQ